jgi:DNA polymerase III epsilon subunit
MTDSSKPGAIFYDHAMKVCQGLDFVALAPISLDDRGTFDDPASAGVRDDHVLVEPLLRKAAELGHPEAQFCLGALHASGVFVDYDDLEALRWYNRSADQGHPEAAFQIVKYLLLDPPETRKTHAPRLSEPDTKRLLGIAAGGGHAEAQFRLGLILHDEKIWPVGSSIKGRPGFDHLLAAARGGHVKAMAKIASLWARNRRMVEANLWREAAGQVCCLRGALDEARDWFLMDFDDRSGVLIHDDEEGAPDFLSTGEPFDGLDWPAVLKHLGGADAAYTLGVRCADDQDFGFYGSEGWFRLAAKFGHANAMLRLAEELWDKWIELDDATAAAEAIDWYQAAEEAGQAEAREARIECLVSLGEHYADASQPPDLRETRRWFTMAAEEGDAEAQYRLGHLVGGAGFDPSIAFSWILKAAEQGHPQAQYQIGWRYAQGVGVDANQELAARWYREAAEQDNPSGQNNLGCCYANGTGVEKDLELAQAWFQRAASQSHAQGMYNFGLAYLYGWGTAVSKDEALSWFRKALDAGHEAARTRIEELTRPPAPPTPLPTTPAPEEDKKNSAPSAKAYGSPRYVVLDFETSGLSPARGDRVIEVGAVEVIDGRIGRQYQSLAKPGFPISARITEITTITNAMLRTAPPVEQVMRELAAFIEGATLVAHNAPFDLKFLQAELERLDLWDECDILCTLQLGRRTCPGLPSYKLRELAIHLGVELPDTFHRAMADAMTAAHIFVRIQTPTGSATIDLFRDPPRQPEPPRAPAAQPAPMPPPVQAPTPPATPPPPRGDPVPPPTAPPARDEPPSVWNRIVRVFR